MTFDRYLRHPGYQGRSLETRGRILEVGKKGFFRGRNFFKDFN